MTPASQRAEEDLTHVLAIGLLSVLVLLAAIFYLRWRRSRKGRAILITGVSGSGKTLCWANLLGKKECITVTSLKANNGKFVDVKQRVWELIDVPGFPRVRYQCFEESRSQARGIVFVVDSSTLQKEVRDVAEFLYLILTDSFIRSTRPKIAIFCNKQDLPLSKSDSAIRTLLEREINTLRLTKSSQLESLGNAGNNNSYFLGREGKEFTFADVAEIGIDLKFLLGSVTNDDIEPLRSWIKTL